MSITHTFAGNPFNREDARRRDEDWLARAQRDPRARYLVLANLSVPLSDNDEAALAWTNGVDPDDLDAQPIFLGTLDDVPHFALDIADSGLADDLMAGIGRFEEARSAATLLGTADAGIVAQARSQVDWHRRHGFCAVCGGRTVSRRGGQARTCKSCGAEHFPRTDPVAIMVIADGERCLLGQSHGRLSATRMYSALAGFIDQGESIEEAVRREVMEEAGIEVGKVVYHSSQPWPFPSSLMIGCHGGAASREISIDPAEMADVRWMARDEVLAGLDGRGSLRLPGPIAIAHHLIKAWAYGETDF